VAQVLADLEAEGWLHQEAGSGTFVRADLLAARPPEKSASAHLGFPLRDAPALRRRLEVPEAEYRLVGGRADLRLLPLTELARAYRRVLRGRGRRLVDYGPPRGTSRLRGSLRGWLGRQRGLAPTDRGLLVTRGSQQAIYLLARALLRPGDVVAVEALGYPPAWAALRAAGATLFPLPVDDEGARVDQIPDHVRAVYLTPHHQYPTGATLSAPRRQRLLAQAARCGFAVLEDDYDHEYHYEGAPVPPLASDDPAGVVVSIGTLSKAFAPGLRLGWVVAPPPLIDQLVAWRTMIDRQGDQVVEHAVAELLDEGTLDRHLRRTRRHYQARRDTLLRALARRLPQVTPLPRPGGLALWCRVEGNDVDAWAERCQQRGVFFETASAYTLDGRALPWARLGFAGHDEGELLDAVERMRAAWPSIEGQG